MAIAITDLVKDLSREEILEDLLTVAKALKLSTTAWQPGEPLRKLLTILADQLSKLWNNYIVKAIRAGFLDYAEGGWLTLLAFVTYGVIRRESTFAGGDLALENRGGLFLTLVPGDIRVSNGTKTYTNTTGGVLAPWDGVSAFPTLTLSFSADEAGSASSTATFTIQDWPTPPTAAPAGVFATPNDAPWVGEDEEEDDSLRDRARIEASATSPAGPKDAYRAVALRTKRADGTNVNITRCRVVDAGNCEVNVWLASAGGAATGDTATPGSDVYVANQQIQLLVVPAGITANVAAAVELPVSAFMTVFVDRASNLTNADAVKTASDAVTKYFAKLPIGGNRVIEGGQGYVYRDEIVAKASESAEGIFRATCDLFGGDVNGNIALADNEVAVGNFLLSATLVTQ